MAMTRASRNIGLRTFYDPLNPPAAKPQPIPPSLVPRPIDGGFGWEPVHPAYSPGGGVDMTPVSGNRELSAMSPPPTSGNPQLSAMSPPPTSGSPELSAMSPPPSPAGSPEMQAWGGGVPLPPVRPSGLGGRAGWRCRSGKRSIPAAPSNRPSGRASGSQPVHAAHSAEQRSDGAQSTANERARSLGAFGRLVWGTKVNGLAGGPAVVGCRPRRADEGRRSTFAGAGLPGHERCGAGAE